MEALKTPINLTDWTIIYSLSSLVMLTALSCCLHVFLWKVLFLENGTQSASLQCCHHGDLILYAVLNNSLTNLPPSLCKILGNQNCVLYYAYT